MSWSLQRSTVEPLVRRGAEHQGEPLPRSSL
jgi:hypothetical protein